MNKFVTLAAAAALSLAAAPAFAAMPMSVFPQPARPQSAGEIYNVAANATAFDITRVGPGNNVLVSSGGLAQVQLANDALRQILSQNSRLAPQLASAGINLHDVVGASADSNSTITLYVRG